MEFILQIPSKFSKSQQEKQAFQPRTTLNKWNNPWSHFPATLSSALVSYECRQRRKKCPNTFVTMTKCTQNGHQKPLLLEFRRSCLVVFAVLCMWKLFCVFQIHKQNIKKSYFNLWIYEKKNQDFFCFFFMSDEKEKKKNKRVENIQVNWWFCYKLQFHTFHA